MNDKQLTENPVAKKVYLEALRIIAIFFIIFNHTGSEGFSLFTIRQSSPLYWHYMSLSILCKTAVPIFWMISGSLLLAKEEPLTKVLKKRELRFWVIILLFSFLQFAYRIILDHKYTFSILIFIKAVTTTSMAGTYWYLYSFAALILMMPFLRKIAVNTSNKEYVYLMSLNIIFLGLLPITQFLIWNGKNYFVPDFSPLIATNGYIVYPLVGYFIENRISSEYYNKKNAFLLIFFSIISIIVSCLMTQYQANITGVLQEQTMQTFYNSLILIPSITIFYLIKYCFESLCVPMCLNKLIIIVGNTTLGVMLIENIVREQTRSILDILKTVLHLPSILACLIWVSCILLICSSITLVMKKLPLLNKLI
ncbi:MAG: acyltransferase [Paenibacillaceae bacterium]|nr:acyltransferase [Paenibacillaceae bacterium]